MLDATPRSPFDIVPWNSSFETGIAIIDAQHRQLVALLNELAHTHVCGAEHSETELILDALVDYAAYHFATEEALWAELPVNDNFIEGHLKKTIVALSIMSEQCRLGSKQMTAAC